MAADARRILIVSDKFKGSLSAREAVRTISQGLERTLPTELVRMPVSDGGEGTASLLVEALSLTSEQLHATDPSNRRVPFDLVWLTNETALIESAQLCGPAALGGDSHPLEVGTWAVGTAILAALKRGPRHLVVTVGGSRTVDGGLGALLALGVNARAEDESKPAPNGTGLIALHHLDVAPAREALGDASLSVWCDVASPLDRARLYMAQKGASAEEREQLDAALERMAALTQPALADQPGTGAAGGLPFGLGLLGAELAPGAERILEALDVPGRLQHCTLVVGGEGSVDQQTAEGKAMAALARFCKEAEVPLILLCGAREQDLEPLYESGVTAVFSMQPGPGDLQTAMENAAANLETLAADIGRFISRLLHSGAP